MFFQMGVIFPFVSVLSQRGSETSSEAVKPLLGRANKRTR